MTGIYIDKNGNWKVQVNLVLSIEVETDRNTWEPARNLKHKWMTKILLQNSLF